MQNDFGAPGGMFASAGIDISGIRATVPKTKAVLDAARRVGATVVYLKMAFKPDLTDAGYPAAPTWLKHVPLRAGSDSEAPDGSPSRVLIRDCWNTEILPELAPRENDLVVYKHRYSGFYETDLHQILAARGIDTLVFTGCTTSVCVESTLRDAMYRDYRCLLLEDCCAEPIGSDRTPSNHDASLLVLEILFGWIADASTFLAAANNKAQVSA